MSGKDEISLPKMTLIDVALMVARKSTSFSILAGWSPPKTDAGAAGTHDAADWQQALPSDESMLPTVAAPQVVL